MTFIFLQRSQEQPPHSMVVGHLTHSLVHDFHLCVHAVIYFFLFFDNGYHFNQKMCWTFLFILLFSAFSFSFSVLWWVDERVNVKKRNDQPTAWGCSQIMINNTEERVSSSPSASILFYVKFIVCISVMEGALAFLFAFSPHFHFSQFNSNFEVKVTISKKM